MINLLLDVRRDPKGHSREGVAMEPSDPVAIRNWPTLRTECDIKTKIHNNAIKRDTEVNSQPVQGEKEGPQEGKIKKKKITEL